MGPETSKDEPAPNPSKDPRQVVREWKREIRKSQREIQRQMRDIKLTQQKTGNEIKALMKRGDSDNAKILAKEVIRSRKAIDRFYTSSVQLDSIMSELDHQLGLIRTTKAVQTSTEILKLMNSCVKVSELTDV